jgi:tRNA (guanine-N7-)-methyltransferase
MAASPGSARTSCPSSRGRSTRSDPKGRVFGRRRGRPLRPARAARLSRLLPALSIPALPGPAALDPASLFPARPAAVWLESGFGAGEHLAAQAEANPSIGFIGAEPFVNGQASLAALVEARGLGNVRIWPDDGAPLLEALSNCSIGRAFLLFPDPWPKTRHHKRRFVTPATVAQLARALADGAELRMATDDHDYAAWMLFHVLAHPAFAWTARGPRDWWNRPADWPQSRYEAKALEMGKRPIFLRFLRRPRAV